MILFLAFGARAGFGLYLPPMSLAFGWRREELSLSLALQQIVWGALGPLAGAVADRYGTGHVVAAGACSYMVGLIGWRSAQTPLAEGSRRRPAGRPGARRRDLRAGRGDRPQGARRRGAASALGIASAGSSSGSSRWCRSTRA